MLLHMPELDPWWRDVAAFLAAAPVTRHDELVLFAVLRLTGCDDPVRRRAGLHLVTTPEAHALSYWRQYLIGPGVRPASEQPWWLGSPEEGFWSALEAAAVAQRRESAEEIRRQLRCKGGRLVAGDCREMWPHFAQAPELLAAQMLKGRWVG